MKRKLDDNDAPSVEVPREDKAENVVSFDSFGLDPRLMQAIAKSNFSTNMKK